MNRRSPAAPEDICVIYARVSTAEQQQSGGGINGQVGECSGFAARSGWQVHAVHVEPEAVSGSIPPMERPALAAALQDLTGGCAGILLTRRSDRIARKARDLLELRDRADAEGWAFATADGRIDLTTAAGRAMFGMNAVFAEMERDIIRERTREALAAKRAAGVRLGRPRSLPLPVVREIVRLRQHGATFRAIAEDLNSSEVPTAQGGRCWQPGTIAAVLRSQAARDLGRSDGHVEVVGVDTPPG